MERHVIRCALGWAIAAALAASGSPAAAADGSDDAGPPAVRTVDHVDLARYAGTWHQIALIPNRFQKQCASGSTAVYELREDGRIRVVNRCRRADGEWHEARGVAKVENRETNAELKVSFVSFLRWRPFWGDYWIVGLDPDYRWAAVGTPDRKYGWILARTPELDEASLETIFAVLEGNGYDRAAFEMSAP